MRIRVLGYILPVLAYVLAVSEKIQKVTRRVKMVRIVFLVSLPRGHGRLMSGFFSNVLHTRHFKRVLN